MTSMSYIVVRPPERVLAGLGLGDEPPPEVELEELPPEPFFGKWNFWQPLVVSAAAGIASNLALILFVAGAGAIGLRWVEQKMTGG